MPTMGTNQTPRDSPDPTAVFACALSLWRESMRRCQSEREVNLSECYNGGDEFMRVIMRIGTQFEEWACTFIQFEDLDNCWPYLLEAQFGEACIALMDITSLDRFCDDDCLAVALRLHLPVKADGILPVPIDISAGNPVLGSEFRSFRIQTVREGGDGAIEPFTGWDDLFDESFGPPFFGFYGVYADGMLEHIADFKSYSDAVRLARKLSPGIQFPDVPISR